MVLAGEQRLALEHFRKDTSCTPDVHLHIVFLPCEHDFWGSVVSSGDITGHLRILYTCQTEIADLEVAVLVDQNIARLKVTVDDTRGMDIFQSTLPGSVSCLLAQLLTRTKI